MTTPENENTQTARLARLGDRVARLPRPLRILLGFLIAIAVTVAVGIPILDSQNQTELLEPSRPLIYTILGVGILAYAGMWWSVVGFPSGESGYSNGGWRSGSAVLIGLVAAVVSVIEAVLLLDIL